MSDVEFETIKADEIKFGKNNFLEVARKKAVSGEGSNEFIAISRGFYLQDGTKRFRRSLALPDDAEIIEFVVSKLKEFHSGKSVPKVEEQPAQAEEQPAETKTKAEAEAPQEAQ